MKIKYLGHSKRVGNFSNIINDTELKVTYKEQIVRGFAVDYYSGYEGDFVIPETVYYDGTTYTVTRIGEYAFTENILTSITIPKSIKVIDGENFADCSKLTSVHISDIASWCEIYFGPNKNTFNNSDNRIIHGKNLYLNGVLVEDLIIPDGTTKISNAAFSYCNQIKSVRIPKSVTDIGYYAFYSDNPLTVYSEIEFPFDCYAFNEYTQRNGTLYIPAGTKDYYTRFDGWRQFLNIVEMEEHENTLVSQINLNTTNQELIQGQTFQLSATVIPNNATNKNMKWSSSNMSVATVSNSGLITAIAAGSTVITCTAQDGSGVKATCNVTVKASSTSQNIQFADVEVKRICVQKWDSDNDGELSKAEAANVQSLGYAFGLSSITTFDELRYFTGLTTIDEHAFDRCPNLQLVTIPSQITSIGRAAFSACGELTTINLPEGLTTIEEMSFERCSGLKSITIPSKVTSIGRAAFSACSSLTSITLPEGLTSIPELCFERCSGLKSINIPASVNSIGNNAFAQCNSLEEIMSDILDPYNIDASVFTNTIYASAKLIVPKGTQSKYRNALGWKNFSNIVESEPSDSPIVFADAEVKRICVENWDTNGDGELSEKEASVVIDLGSVFKGNSSIKQFDELRFFSSLESIGNYEFDGCKRLGSIVLPNTVKSIGKCAFYNSGLKSVIIPNGVVSIKHAAFRYCISLESIILPSSLTTIDSESLEFCDKLTTITIPKSVTYLGSAVLSYCESLQSIIIEDGNVNYTSINGILYNKDKTNLQIYPAGKTEKEFVIPSHVTAIESFAFYGCQNLESITIHKDVTHIGEMAFMNCIKLTSFTVKRAEPVSIGAKVFGNDFLSNGILYVPYGSKANYQVATGWKDFCNIIESEEEPAIITAKSYSREYGEPNPEFDFISEGAEIFGTPSISCTATKTSPVGSYDITISKGSIENGKVTYVKGTLKITKAPLTIKAGEYTKYQGSENPEFKPTYEGFKNGETEAVLTKKPIVTTAADKDSPVGVYNVFVSGAEAQNYNISYIAGTLTVKNRPKGDPDAKGYTDVTDVVAAINHVLGERTLNYDEKELLDMNNDGELNVGDIILLVKAILEQGNHFEIPTLARGDAETVDLTQYTAMQLTVNVPSGARIRDIRLAGDNNSSHSLMYQQTDYEHYTVVVYSMSNQKFKPVNGCLLEVDVEGNGEPMTADVLLATPSGERAFISTLPIGTSTGITEVSVNQLATGNVYDLRGNKVLDSGVSLKQLTKGVYIMNGKKMIR